MQKTREEINRYLTNQMSDQEMDDFELACKNDPELMQELKIEAIIRQELNDKREKAVYAEIVAIPLDEKKTNPLASPIWLYAAAAILLILLLWNFLSSPSSPSLSSSELYAQVYERPLSPDNLMGTSQIDSLQALAFEAYDNGDFQRAKGRFGEILKVESNEDLAFYQAISELEIGEFDLAITHLSELVPENKYQQDRKDWYLAMAYLQKGELDQATQEIQEIAKKGTHNFSSMATSYLNLIGSE